MKYHRENYDIDKISPLWVDYQVTRLIKPKSTILEIGCTMDYVGKHMKEKLNCSVWGIEIGKKSSKLVKHYYEK